MGYSIRISANAVRGLIKIYLYKYTWPWEMQFYDVTSWNYVLRRSRRWRLVQRWQVFFLGMLPVWRWGKLLLWGEKCEKRIQKTNKLVIVLEENLKLGGDFYVIPSYLGWANYLWRFGFSRMWQILLKKLPISGVLLAPTTINHLNGIFHKKLCAFLYLLRIQKITNQEYRAFEIDSSGDLTCRTLLGYYFSSMKVHSQTER